MKDDATFEQLQRLAREVGIAEVGVTTAEPFPELTPWLMEYEARGRTGFEAGDIGQRIYPAAWLASVRSIIVIAVPYLSEEGERTARSHPIGSHHGLASCYTYGEDYHRVLSTQLQALHQRMEEALGRSIEARLSVDTSPLVDRRIAERAGLGWIGKNAMFYSHRFGSFVFIGAMLVDISISPKTVNPPDVGKHCGSCTFCLQACPTGAIVAPGVIDATRCLSYVTQMKGIIPLHFRSKMGRRVWGCDVCQWSCPENRGKDRSEMRAFQPMREAAYPDLVELLHLSNRQFVRKFGHTAMAWRGLRTLQRNALIALGNTGREDAVSEIVPFLHSDRLELRASAAWALGQIGGSVAKQQLMQALDRESDPLVAEELVNGVESCRECG